VRPAAAEPGRPSGARAARRIDCERPAPPAAGRRARARASQDAAGLAALPARVAASQRAGGALLVGVVAAPRRFRQLAARGLLPLAAADGVAFTRLGAAALAGAPVACDAVLWKARARPPRRLAATRRPAGRRGGCGRRRRRTSWSRAGRPARRPPSRPACARWRRACARSARASSTRCRPSARRARARRQVPGRPTSARASSKTPYDPVLLLPAGGGPLGAARRAAACAGSRGRPRPGAARAGRRAGAQRARRPGPPLRGARRAERGARLHGWAQVDALGPDTAAELAAAGVRFPLVLKPLAACGAPGAHRMAAVAATAGLARAGAVAVPALAQEFVDHGGTMHKVYVIGGAVRPRGPASRPPTGRACEPGAGEPGAAAQVRVSERPSMPDMAPGPGAPAGGQPDCVLFDSQRMAPGAAGAPAAARPRGAASSGRGGDRAPLAGPGAAARRPLDRALVNQAAALVQRALRLRVFGFDVLVESATGAPRAPRVLQLMVYITKQPARIFMTAARAAAPPRERPGAAWAEHARAAQATTASWTSTTSRPSRTSRTPGPRCAPRSGRPCRAPCTGSPACAGRAPLWRERVCKRCERRRGPTRSVRAWRSVRAQVPWQASRPCSDWPETQSRQLRQHMLRLCRVGVAVCGGSRHCQPVTERALRRQ